MDIVADTVVESLLSRDVYARLTSIEKELLDVALIRDLQARDAAALLGVSVTAYTSRVSRLRKRIEDIRSALTADDGNFQ